ncbi:formate dehydrogenase accessory protein FdhE [Candidatus Bathyarchaeota archaeon]|nr:formate dehydrogenase accessory protein FdhE [Candidatus Bathyarchaeota archaeon]
MARPSIQERLSEIDLKAIEVTRNSGLIQLQKSLLKTLLPVEEYLRSNGINLSEEEINSIRDKVLSEKTPTIMFLDAPMFKVDILKIAGEIARVLMENSFYKDSLQPLLRELELNFSGDEVLKAILSSDAEWFRVQGNKLGVDSSLLLFILSTPLQPFFEELARRLEKGLKENWLQSDCPICGRTTHVAKMRNRKKYLVCSYCGAEYLVDLFLCTHCGNVDPNTLGFISLEEYPEFEIDYCEKCRHYIKVIFEERLRSYIPPGLEDLATIELDKFAEREDIGLTRY